MLRIAVLVVVGGGGGCAPGPDLGPRPDPAQPGAFAATRSLAGTSQAWPQDDWWRTFGDTQLDTLVGEALQGSPTVAQAAARNRIAVSQADLARAALLQSVGATATARASRLPHSNRTLTDGACAWLPAGLVTMTGELAY